MGRKKLFLDNFLIYGIGGGLSRLIPFIMLPILTRLYPDSGYVGMNEMFIIGLNFVSIITGLGLFDAMFRFFFEDENKQKKIVLCSSCLRLEIIVDIFAFFILVLLREYMANVLFGDKDLQFLIIILALCVFFTNINSILSAPLRMQNKRKTYLTINIVNSVILYGVTTILVISKQYYYALPLGTLVAMFTSVSICLLINRKWFNIKKIDKHVIKKILRFSLPLMPNVLLFWLFNSADRWMIQDMIGAQTVGVYSVGGKIGHISNLIYTAFAGGWQFFLFSTMKDDDQKQLTCKMFEYLSAITYIFTIMITVIDIPVFKALFEKEYFEGAFVVPYLFMAPLMLMQYQIITDQFLIIKKTIFTLLISIFGAFLNIGLNYYGILLFGYEAAAVATLISYFVMIVISALILGRFEYKLITYRYMGISFVTIVFIILWRIKLYDIPPMNLFLAVIFCLVIYMPFKNETNKLFVRN